MDTLFLLLLIALLLAAYGLLTCSLQILRASELLLFARIRGFFESRKRASASMPKNLVRFLRKKKIHFEIRKHPKAFSSEETAQAAHVPGTALVKTVIVNAVGKHVMAILPSNRTVDLFKLSEVLGKNDLYIETEKEFKDLFAGCEAGALPPFGSLYGMPCYIDQRLYSQDFLYINAGNHEEYLEVPADEFLRAVKGIAADFTVPGKKLHEKARIAV